MGVLPRMSLRHMSHISHTISHIPFMIYISYILYILILPVVRGTLIQDSIYSDIVEPWNIRLRDNDSIHLAMIISGNNKEDIEHFTSKADRMLQTLVSLSKGKSVHLIFITEAPSVPTIARHVESA